MLIFNVCLFLYGCRVVFSMSLLDVLSILGFITGIVVKLCSGNWFLCSENIFSSCFM